jgi:hypothetical protein
MSEGAVRSRLGALEFSADGLGYIHYPEPKVPGIRFRKRAGTLGRYALGRC